MTQLEAPYCKLDILNILQLLFLCGMKFREDLSDIGNIPCEWKFTRREDALDEPNNSLS